MKNKNKINLKLLLQERDYVVHAVAPMGSAMLMVQMNVVHVQMVSAI